VTVEMIGNVLLDPVSDSQQELALAAVQDRVNVLLEPMIM